MNTSNYILAFAIISIISMTRPYPCLNKRVWKVAIAACIIDTLFALPSLLENQEVATIAIRLSAIFAVVWFKRDIWFQIQVREQKHPSMESLKKSALKVLFRKTGLH